MSIINTTTSLPVSSALAINSSDKFNQCDYSMISKMAFSKAKLVFVENVVTVQNLNYDSLLHARSRIRSKYPIGS